MLRLITLYLTCLFKGSERVITRDVGCRASDDPVHE